MKKIVLVSNASWALFNFRLGLIKMLIEHGIEVFCIANYDNYSQKLEELGVTYIKSNVDNKGVNPITDLRYYTFLLNQYREIRPDFIFHYTVKPNIYGSLAAERLNIQSVAFVSGTGYPFLETNFINYIVTTLYKIAGRKCTEMWFINKDDLQLFVDQKLVNKFKTKLLPGEGVDVQHFSRSEPYKRTNEPFIFLLSSRMLWDKGVGVYIEAARIIKKKFPKVSFQLLGFIDSLSACSIKLKQINSWVNEGVIDYLGETDDVRKYLNKINCFVLPSYYKEGIPRTLLEASSMEIPIITTDNVGCREVVKDRYNGLLCKPKDVESLVRCMEMMIEMETAALVQMGKNGRRKVASEFDEELVLTVYKKSLGEFLGNKRQNIEFQLAKAQ